MPTPVGSSAPRTVRLGIGDALGEPGALAGSYHPAAHAASAPLLVCLPGGTYNHRYFDLEVPDRHDYSFAWHLAQLGCSVLALDQLGTGDSSRPDRDIDLGDQAAAAHAAVQAFVDGTGHDGPVIAVGHSMGGYVAMVQQANHHTYDRLAILGTTNQHVVQLALPDQVVAAAASAAGRAALLEEVRAALPERYSDAAREPMRSWFHLDDVPDEVVAADDATTLTVVPRGPAAAAMVPGIAREEAATIDVPVFLAYGEVDISPAPHLEPSFFGTSPDVTLFVLAESAHCHNMASSRTVLWDRLARWSASALPAANR